MTNAIYDTFVLTRVDTPRVTFVDREDAGSQLARVLVPQPDPDAVVLALPRGGVPVAVPVAAALGCELRPVAVRKLPLPTSPEMGFGAVTLQGTAMLNQDVMREFGVSMEQAGKIAEEVRGEVARRAGTYPGAAELPFIRGRRVFLVDDGLATGYTAIAACAMIRRLEPAELIVAVPVAPMNTIELVSRSCDEVVCLLGQTGSGFAVASFYRFFPDLTDDEVSALLSRYDRQRTG